jgi:hypothetical protein
VGTNAEVIAQPHLYIFYNVFHHDSCDVYDLDLSCIAS